VCSVFSPRVMQTITTQLLWQGFLRSTLNCPPCDASIGVGSDFKLAHMAPILAMFYGKDALSSETTFSAFTGAGGVGRLMRMDAPSTSNAMCMHVKLGGRPAAEVEALVQEAVAKALHKV
jgi:hypothetical protein